MNADTDGLAVATRSIMVWLMLRGFVEEHRRKHRRVAFGKEKLLLLGRRGAGIAFSRRGVREHAMVAHVHLHVSDRAE